MRASFAASQTAEPGGLSDADIEVVQGAIEYLDERAARMGVELRIETDFEEFARVRRAAGGVVNQTVDPKFSRLDRDAFWARALDRHGNLIGLHAIKVFRAPNFMDLLRSERLWFDLKPHAVSPQLNILDPFEPFGGTVSHGAGLWVNPNFRERGFSAFIPEYTRALALKLYHIEWHTLFVFAQHQAHASRAYGCTRVEKVIDGYCPITGSETELYLGLLSRADIVRRLETINRSTEVSAAVGRPTRAAAAG